MNSTGLKFNPPPLRGRETHPQGAWEGGTRSVLACCTLSLWRGAPKLSSESNQLSTVERPPSASCYALAGFAGCSLPLKGGESFIVSVRAKRGLQIVAVHA